MENKMTGWLVVQEGIHMAEFKELIKNFNKCRDYVRDFFVYGFKSRQDFTSDRKSARTYDDERRRITGWLSEYVVEDRAKDSGAEDNPSRNPVKNISLQMDSNLLDTNPLFSVWKTKSFTDNDILLHFFLLDLLQDAPAGTGIKKGAAGLSYEQKSLSLGQIPAADSDGQMQVSACKPAYTAGELADLLSENYAFPADTQLVRRKCNEYVKEGLLEAEKDGKTLRYRRGLAWVDLFPSGSTEGSGSMSCRDNGEVSENAAKNSVSVHSGCMSRENSWEASLLHAISLFQMDTPFGYIGNTVLDGISQKNRIFRVKHSFPAFTLEEEITDQLLAAKKAHSYVKMEVISNRNGQTPGQVYGVPLKILVSARTGRRYVCIYHRTQERIHAAARNRRRGSAASKREPKYHFRCVRLDQIKSVTVMTSGDAGGAKSAVITATTDAFAAQQEALARNLPFVWGVSFEGMRTRVSLTLKIDERCEGFILNRLEREGKQGTVTRLEDNVFRYEKVVFDAKEMFPWLRTFIGRIVDVRFVTLNEKFEEIRENTSLRQQFLEDIEALSKFYI